MGEGFSLLKATTQRYELCLKFIRHFIGAMAKPGHPFHTLSEVMYRMPDLFLACSIPNTVERVERISNLLRRP